MTDCLRFSSAGCSSALVCAAPDVCALSTAPAISRPAANPRTVANPVTCRRSASIQLFQTVPVPGGDDVTAQLHRRRHHLVLDRERFRRDDDAADALDDRQVGVDALDRIMQFLLQGVVIRHIGEVVLLAVALRPVLEKIRVGNDDRDEMRAAVAKDHRLLDLRCRREDALDARGRQVVTAGIDDDVLLAVGDLDKSVLIDAADIAGMQPAVADGFGGCVGIVPIALHDQFAAHKYLAVLGDPSLRRR